MNWEMLASHLNTFFCFFFKMNSLIRNYIPFTIRWTCQYVISNKYYILYWFSSFLFRLRTWQKPMLCGFELEIMAAWKHHFSRTEVRNFAAKLSSCSFSLAFFLSTPIEKLLLRIKRGEIGCEFSGSHWLVVSTYLTASFLLFFWVSQCKQCWYFLMQFLFYYWIFH